MEVAERVVTNKHRATMEYNKALLEKKAKTEAWQETKKVKTCLDAATQELKKEKDAHVASLERLSKVQDELNVERGVSASLRAEIEVFASLRAEVEKLRKALAERETELVKVTETLETVERNAKINYNDCVEKFRASEEYIEEVEIKAGVFHEEGWNDCLAFIGTGNAANPEVYVVERFRALELAKAEKEKAGAEARREGEALKGGDGNAEVAAETRGTGAETPLPEGNPP